MTSRIDAIGQNGNDGLHYSLKKNIPWRSKKIREAAKDCPHCMDCGKPNDGTIVGCHYTGNRQHELGKGMAQKGTDGAVAYLCRDCHVRLDQYFSNGIEQSEQFLFAIVKTHNWLLEQGIFK